MISLEKAMQANQKLNDILSDPLLSEEEKQLRTEQKKEIGKILQQYSDGINSDVPTNFALDAQSQAAEYRQKVQRERKANMTTSEKVAELGGNLLGTGEALLTLGSGATTGAVGQLAGVAVGILQGLRSDEAFTSTEVQQDIERIAASISSKTVYTPKTPQGQEIVQSLGKFLEPLAALIPTMNFASVPFFQTLRMSGKQVKESMLQRKVNVEQGKLEPVEVIKIAQDAATGKSNLGSWAALAAEQDPVLVEAAKRLGILEYMQLDHLTTNQQFKELAQALKSIPANKYRAIEVEGLEAINRRLKEVIDDLGTKDASQIDYDVRVKLTEYEESLSKRANKINDEVVKPAIPETDRVDIPNLSAVMAEFTEKFGGYQNIPEIYRQLFEKLAGKDGKGRPTFTLFDDTRKELNASFKGTGEFDGYNQTKVKEILSIMREDGRAIAKSYGVGDAYDAMQSLYKVGFSVRDDLVALFGREVDKSLIQPLLGAIGKLKSGDVMSIKKFLESVPDDMRNQVLVSGLAAAFRKGDQAVNFVNYQKFYEAIVANKQARKLMFQEMTPAQRRVFVDLYKVSKAINSTLKERIRTGRTETAVAVLNTKVNNLFNGILSKVGRAATMTGEPATSFVFSRLGKGQDVIVRDVIENVLDSKEFNNVVRFIGTEREDAALDAFLRKKGSFMKSALGIGSPEQFMKQLIAAEAGMVEPQEEEEKRK